MSGFTVDKIERDLYFHRKCLENTRRSIKMGIAGMQDQAKRIESEIEALELRLKEATNDSKMVQKGRKRIVPKRAGRKSRGKKAKS